MKQYRNIGYYVKTYHLLRKSRQIPLFSLAFHFFPGYHYLLHKPAKIRFHICNHTGLADETCHVRKARHLRRLPGRVLDHCRV